MTKIYFTQSNGEWVGFRISGHTGKAEEGKDVLCSAISTASQMAVLAIVQVAKVKAEVEIRDGFLSLTLDQPNHDTQLIIESLYQSLMSICENEKKYVKLEVKYV